MVYQDTAIMENTMCTGCLSTDRKLFFIGETGYYHLYTQILNEIPVYDVSQICIRVCWECRAHLRRMHRFKLQVKRNYTDLLQQIPPQATSTLSSHSQYNLSYLEVKPETDLDLTVKCEPEPFASAIYVDQTRTSELYVDQARTSELYVDQARTNELCVDQIGDNVLCGDQIEDSEICGEEASGLVDQVIREKNDCLIEKVDRNPVHDNNIKPHKKKKKPKIKLKSSKINVKKKRKSRLKETTLSDHTSLDACVDDSNGHDDDFDKDFDIDSSKDLKDDTEVPTVLPPVILTRSQLAPVAVKVKVKVKPATPLPDRPQCQECGKVFSSKKTYRYHLNVLHKGQNQYPCPRCGKVYQWKSNLGRHMRSHRAVDDGELFCALCDKSFASVATYRQHLRISRRHVPEAEFSFACEECGKRFVNKTRLRDHIDWEHLHRIKFRCTLCDKPFKCHTSLYVHTQNVHVAKEKKDNLCHVCGKSYQNAAKLKYHITAMHSGETPYRCGTCAASFGWYSSLYRHMREVHYKMKGGPKKAKKMKQTRVSPPTYAPL